jgi:hypothetical protein
LKHELKGGFFMSSEDTYLLRLLSPGTKELKTTAVDVFGDAAKFTSQLTSGYTRKKFIAYNNTSASSGEVVWGDSTVNGETGMIIPKGEIVAIPCSTDIDIYFCNTVSGEISDLRITEVA